MHHALPGALPPLHTAVDLKNTMPPSLIHADDDAYASLPPTPTSPLELSASHLGWHNQLTASHNDCGQGMYGLSASMNAAVGLGGDVAIAGSGHYMSSYAGHCPDGPPVQTAVQRPLPEYSRIRPPAPLS
ncbi:hypothetical protein NUW54_g12493 [Trametes sanguinea]|uniref:Uncharacterized protein n=1 Tax=Trametes sanguinea TaxID=158606 RepID=A0ACC1MXX2_9APHY|nr:hypothetical protein NUW54_g12493 [Trametes sanguinea]